MKYDEVIRVRLESELKKAINKKSKGNMSEYLRGLAVKDIEIIKTKDHE